MREILLGTHNRHKAEEISNLLHTSLFKIKTLNDFPHVKEVEESGQTLEENALKKAKEYALATGLLTVADDTGLEVDALNGAPGVYSARYAGENCSYKDNNRKLIAELQNTGMKNRKAKFRCVVACYDPLNHKSGLVEGVVHGEILESGKGQNGFGYDPVFYLPQLGKTFAELTLEEKNRASHRSQAILKAKEILQNLCANGS